MKQRGKKLYCWNCGLKIIYPLKYSKDRTCPRCGKKLRDKELEK